MRPSQGDLRGKVLMFLTAQGTGHNNRTEGKLLRAAGYVAVALLAGDNELFTEGPYLQHRIRMGERDTYVNLGQHGNDAEVASAQQ
jgi:hypothetical protein